MLFTFQLLWTQANDTHISEKSSIFSNFNGIRSNVTASNIMVYGDFQVGHDKLSSFIGSKNSNSNTKPETEHMKHKVIQWNEWYLEKHFCKIYSAFHF